MREKRYKLETQTNELDAKIRRYLIFISTLNNMQVYQLSRVVHQVLAGLSEPCIYRPHERDPLVRHAKENDQIVSAQHRLVDKDAAIRDG